MQSEFSIKLNWAPQRRANATQWVFAHIFRHRLWISVMIIGAIGNAAGAALMPMFIGQAFNAVVNRPIDYALIGGAAIGIILSQVVRAVLQLGRNFGSEIIGQRLERDIRHELYASLLGKSMTFHDQQSVGDVMARATNDVREVNLMLNPGLNLVVGSFMFLVMPIVIAPTMQPALILVPLIFAIVYFWLLQSFLNQLRPATESVRRQFGGMNATLAESIEGIETVKGAAQEAQAIEKFESGAKAYRDAFVAQGHIEARFLPLLWLAIINAAGLAHSLLLYQQGLIDVGQVVAFNGLLLLFGFPTFQTSFAYPQIASGLSSARRILELLEAESGLDENRAGYAAKMQGAIQFDQVTFKYRSEVPVLDNVSFEVKPGQTVAVVGQTGSGKTSIIKLLNRIYEATEGHVRIDGIDVRDWQLAALRQQISIIEQDLFLFSRTVAENIKFGCPDATPAEVETAARAAQAHEFIMNFTHGYDTIVGERGVTLSGGQRQRLALARALLTDPKILILDDATSAIDSATEDQIQQAIYTAARGRTTILITHRLSQIRWADVIVVMKQGQVAAIGSHEELLATSPAYQRIFAR
ncbi:MAG TPA: ABC transporter ATP-binding protein [Anaerolineae bacterium]|nr:ABC transporter ATP-binding protein [Anaerolineae bacterium]